jgi:hypothetical protein
MNRIKALRVWPATNWGYNRPEPWAINELDFRNAATQAAFISSLGGFP